MLLSAKRAISPSSKSQLENLVDPTIYSTNKDLKTDKSRNSDDFQKEMAQPKYGRKTTQDLNQPRKTQKKTTFLANIKPLKIFSQDDGESEKAVHFAQSESMKGREMFRSILSNQRKTSLVQLKPRPTTTQQSKPNVIEIDKNDVNCFQPMVFNEERRWELVHNSIFHENVKAQSGLMRQDYHYMVGPKFPFHFKELHLHSMCMEHGGKHTR